MPIEFEVHALATHDPAWRYLILIHPHPPIPKLFITERTTIGSVPAVSLYPPPRLLGPDGKQRQDILCLRLHNRPTDPTFQPGQKVLLQHYLRPLEETTLPELQDQILQEIHILAEEPTTPAPPPAWLPDMLDLTRQLYQLAPTPPLDPRLTQAYTEKLTRHILTHRLKGFSHHIAYAERLHNLASESI